MEQEKREEIIIQASQSSKSANISGRIMMTIGSIGLIFFILQIFYYLMPSSNPDKDTESVLSLVLGAMLILGPSLILFFLGRYFSKRKKGTRSGLLALFLALIFLFLFLYYWIVIY